jgi:cysteine desulfurase/selenocysteine lyase
VTNAAATGVAGLRSDFPLLRRQVHGKPLVYLDSAASAPMPTGVMEAMTRYASTQHANVHRGVHALSQEATAAYEGARETVRQFINARSSREIIFTRGTTESINLVAQSWGRTKLRAGDEVLITQLEHHANIVPWQMACAATGARLIAAPLTTGGELDLAAFAALVNSHTRLIAVAQVSNVLGTLLPLAEIAKLARQRGIPLLVDGAQAVAHQQVDVQAIDCDFYAFSAHKLYGPTGIGVLYGRESLLAVMPPWQGGGDMIRSVSIESSEWNELPWKFEAGTPHIAGAIGLAAAIDYVRQAGIDALGAHELALARKAEAALSQIKNLKIIGNARHKAAVISFTLDHVHPHDIGTILDLEGIAIRTGHHCAMPLMEYLGLAATARASFACFNNEDDVAQLIRGVQKVIEVFR